MTTNSATLNAECLRRIADNAEKCIGLVFSADGTEFVLGAGGMKCLAEIGGAKAVEKHRVKVRIITGISGGAILAAFLSCGYTAAEILQIFMTEGLWKRIAELLNSVWNVIRSGFGVRGGIVKELRHLLRALFEKKGIVANPRLRIIAFNLKTKKPIVFEGTRYDVADAVAASCAIPVLIASVPYKPVEGVADEDYISEVARESMQKAGTLVDGGLQGLCPRQYCQGSALAFQVELAAHLPSVLPTPIEAVFHASELVFGRLLSKVVNIQSFRGKGKEDDVVITIGGHNIGGLSFSAPAAQIEDVVAEGYRIAYREISPPIHQGRLLVAPRAVA